MPAPPNHPVTIQITVPEGVEITREPNDPNLGSKILGNVKNHIRRRDLLRKIEQKFESRENNRSQIFILEAMGGRKLYFSSKNQQLKDSRSRENTSCHRLLPSMTHGSPILPILGHILP